MELLLMVFCFGNVAYFAQLYREVYWKTGKTGKEQRKKYSNQQKKKFNATK